MISWLLASLADSEIFCLTSHCGSDGSWSPLVCGWSYFAISLCYSLRCAALVFSLMPTELLSTFGFDVLVRCCISLLVITALPWCDYGMGELWFLTHGQFDLCITEPKVYVYFFNFLTDCSLRGFGFIYSSNTVISFRTINILRPKLKKNKNSKCPPLGDVVTLWTVLCFIMVLLQNICTRENTQNNHLFF